MASEKPRLAFLRDVPPFPLAVLVGCIVVLAVVGIAEDLRTGLLQVVLLLLGIWSSYSLGQGKDVRPHVRGAYRRAANLYSQQSALTVRIADLREKVRDTDPDAVSERACDALDSIEWAVEQNLSVILDAMADWEDVVPEEAAELKRSAEQQAEPEMDAVEPDAEVDSDEAVELLGPEGEEEKP